MYKNKRGQLENPIIIFIMVVIGLIFLAPIILKVANTVLDPFADAVGNQTEQAGVNVRHVKTTFVNFWDWVIIIAFGINVLLLFITAFLVDTHPVFLVLYILFAFFTMIFAPEILQAVDQIYDGGQFTEEVNSIPMIDFIRTYFGLIIMGVIFLSGVVMYGKYRLMGTPRLR
jgi:hypothetical protein